MCEFSQKLLVEKNTSKADFWMEFFHKLYFWIPDIVKHHLTIKKTRAAIHHLVTRNRHRHLKASHRNHRAQMNQDYLRYIGSEDKGNIFGAIIVTLITAFIVFLLFTVA